MADGYFVTPADAEQVTMVEGVHRRTMATTDEAMICEFFYETGAVIQPHSHTNDQVGYVVFGKLEVTIGNQTREVHQGDSYAIPGGIEHCVTAVKDSLTLEIFSPPRNDYRTEAR